MSALWSLVGEILPPRLRAAGAADAVRRAVEQHPGITSWELKERTLLSWGTLYHHLAKLEESGEIRSVAAGRRRLFIAASSLLTASELQARALLRGPTAERIAVAIAEGQEQVTVGLLCKTVGESPRVVYYHVKQLIAAHLVTPSSRSRRRGLRPTGLLLCILQDRERPDPSPERQVSHVEP